MSKDNITFVYSAIIREKHTILSEHTEFSGNFFSNNNTNNERYNYKNREYT